MIKVLVNPMQGWTNCPQINIYDKYPMQILNRQYVKTESCYWTQDKDTGVTDFLFNSSPLENGKATQKTEGFGGREFHLKVKGLGNIILYGAWSGGSYCANQYLPKPTIEITFKEPNKISGTVSYMTVEKVNELLKSEYTTGWSVSKITESDTDFGFECVFKGLKKKELSSMTLLELQTIYDSNKGY